MPTERTAPRRLLPMLSLVFVPLTISSVLLAVTCRGAIWDCVPFWNDEVWYWNEIAVFHRAGWQGGYTVINETPAKAEWCHFGVHGPFFPAFYGALTRWTGLHACSIPLLNTSLLMLGTIVWIGCGWRRGERSWEAVLVVATFWPLILYLPTSMQETLHFALAFLLAAVLGWFLRKPLSRPALFASLAVVLAATQIRVTWCLLTLPLIWLAIRPQRWSGRLTAAVAAALLMGLSFYEATLIYAPVPNFMREVIVRAADSPPDALLLVVKHAMKNAGRYLAPKRDTWLEIGLRWQVITVMVAAALCLRAGRESSESRAATRPRWLVRLFDINWWSTTLGGGTRFNTTTSAKRAFPATNQTAVDDVTAPVYLFALVNLLCIVGFVLSLYDVSDWRDYRVIAPHLLLSLLLLVGGGTRRCLGAYALVNLVLAAFVIGQFERFHGPRIESHGASIAALKHDVEGAIKFIDGAPGWDNTILMHIEQLDTKWLGLPRGIGISVVYDWSDQSWPQRSRYLLLRPDEAAKLDVSESMRKVATTTAGDIYARPVELGDRKQPHSLPELVSGQKW
jgi:hypothetical protein